MKNIIEGELLTLVECEQLTKRKVSTWRKDCRLRRVPFVKLGRQFRISRRFVEGMIEAGFRPAIDVEP